MFVCKCLKLQDIRNELLDYQQIYMNKTVTPDKECRDLVQNVVSSKSYDSLADVMSKAPRQTSKCGVMFS